MKIKNHTYFLLIPLVLTIIQAVFIFHSFGYIRYEDLAESVRNPFWLEHRTIYDGTSSNVGWYGTMLIIYKFIGFHIYAARFYRIFLYAVFIFVSANLLKNLFGVKKSIIPLITFGLSPTILYLNTFQAAYGLDVQYFVIMMGILYSLSIKNHPFMRIYAIGFLAMWAAMSYPAGLFLLPALGLACIFKLYSLNVTRQLWAIIFFVGLIGFVTPFLIMLSYLADPNRLLYDKLGGSGIFRGSGSLTMSLSKFWSNTQDNITDYFLNGLSAQFELTTVELSGLYPIISFALVLFISLKIYFTKSKYRPHIIVSTVLFVTSFIGSGMSSWGMRTNASSLIGFYGLFTIAWISMYQTKKHNFKTRFIMAILCLIPVHHVISFFPNYQFIGKPSKVSYQLSSAIGTPEKKLEYIVNEVKNRPLRLTCVDKQNQPISCRYQETYAAVAGACLWNHLPCQGFYGYDLRSKKYIELTPNLWLSYYWAH